MAVLRDAARQVVLITILHYALLLLLLLGSGTLMPPEQTSLLPSPSFCVAPPELYQKIGLLNFMFGPLGIGAVCLAGHHQVAAAGGAGAGAATKMLRAITLMAVALSATSAGIAMAQAYFILQVKAGKVACLSGAVRISVYASYLVIGPILVLCYMDLARMAFLSDE